MLAVQTWRLEVSPIDVIQTTFGSTWLTRMILTIILIGIWFWIERKNKISIKTQIPMLVTALILIATTTMMSKMGPLFDSKSHERKPVLA